MQMYKEFSLYPNYLVDFINDFLYMSGAEVKKILRDNGYSLASVAELMGETPQNLNSLLNAKDIKTGTLEKIAFSIKKSLYFFFQDKVQLMTEEEMLQFDKDELTKSSDLQTKERQQYNAEMPKSPIKEPKSDYTKHAPSIPLVSQTVAAGFGSANFSIEKSDVKAYYVVPKFKDRRIDFMIEVSGGSMYPKYSSGDVVACTIIRESRFIQWNKVHVIATKEQGLLVKRIKEDGEDTIIAVSDNPDYPPFNIPKDEITGIALVVGVIRLE